MKKHLGKFEDFLVNFEGYLLLEINGSSGLPIALEMTEGCPAFDVMHVYSQTGVLAAIPEAIATSWIPVHRRRRLSPPCFRLPSPSIPPSPGSSSSDIEHCRAPSSLQSSPPLSPPCPRLRPPLSSLTAAESLSVNGCAAVVQLRTKKLTVLAVFFFGPIRVQRPIPINGTGPAHKTLFFLFNAGFIFNI